MLKVYLMFYNWINAYPLLILMKVEINEDHRYYLFLLL